MAPLPSFVLCLAAFLLTLLHQRNLHVAVAQNNLTIGSTLTPPNYITSPSGDFAFGFRSHNSDPTQFMLAVWFNFREADF